MIHFFTGLIASTTHVLSGPDHLAAVTPMAVGGQKNTWKIGFVWGIGHTLGVLIIGVLFMVFREFIPVKRISAYSEILVGFVLIGIGVWAFMRFFYRGKEENIQSQKKQRHGSMLSIGILHGFAGFSHILGILPSLALPSAFASGLYLAGFGIGTILAMVLYSAGIGFLYNRLSARRQERFVIGIRIAAASAAVVVGVIWIVLSL